MRRRRRIGPSRCAIAIAIAAALGCSPVMSVDDQVGARGDAGDASHPPGVVDGGTSGDGSASHEAGADACATTSAIASSSLFDFVAALPHAAGYEALSSSQMSAVTAAAAALFAGDLAGAQASADVAGYEARPLATSSEGVLLIRPTTRAPAGQATLIVRSAYSRDLVVEAPHVPTDGNTDTEAAILFDALGARGVVIAGAPRCAVTAYSGCHDNVECDPAGHAVESDPAHSVKSALHAMHLAVVPSAGTIALQLHTNVKPDLNGDALISDGVPDHASPIAQAFTSALRLLGADARTCNDPSTPAPPQAFCGEMNAQGLASNGEADACKGGPLSAAHERFFHLEQYSRKLDEVQAWSQRIAKVLAEVFPKST